MNRVTRVVGAFVVLYVVLGSPAKGNTACCSGDIIAQTSANLWDQVAMWDFMLPTVDGLSYLDASKKWGDGSTQFWAWYAKYRQGLRDIGLKAWQEYPDDPRRFDWLVRTTHQFPFYWEDIEQGSQAYAKQTPALAIPNRAAQVEWGKKYLALRAEFMASPVVKDHMRATLVSVEIGQKSESMRVYGASESEIINLSEAVWDCINNATYQPNETQAVVMMEKLLHIVQRYAPLLESAVIDSFKIGSRADVIRFAIGRETQFTLRSRPLKIAGLSLSGAEVKLENLKGKIVLVDIWSNYCASCIESMPRVQAIYDKYRDSGFVVVGVWLKSGAGADEEGVARKILGKKGATWENVIMAGQARESFKAKYGISGVPVTWLLDREGKLVASDVAGSKLESEVKRLLGAGPSGS